ncbi:hypothetical protein PJI17_03790 [Mycobacterium kansasii]
MAVSRMLAARAARSHHTASAHGAAALYCTPYTVPAGDEVPARTMSSPRVRGAGCVDPPAGC